MLFIKLHLQHLDLISLKNIARNASDGMIQMEPNGTEWNRMEPNGMIVLRGRLAKASAKASQPQKSYQLAHTEVKTKCH